MNTSPHLSPIRLSSPDICLLSMNYGELFTMLLLPTALDAFIAPILGRNPAGGLRRANRQSCRFVSLVFFPPAATCSLRPSPCLQPQGQALGATLRAAVAVQIVYPDDLSLNHSYGYAFGRRHPLAGKILRNHPINW